MLKNLLNRILSPAPAPAPTPTPTPTPEDAAAADALIAEGNREEDAGHVQQADALYRQAVAKAPRHARAHLNLGIVLAAQGDDEGATRAYEAVLAIDPLHPFGNYNFARLAYLHGDYAKAETLARDALRAKPEFAQAQVVLANALEALGKPLPAVEALQAAVRLQPDDAGAWFNLALLLLVINRHDESEVAVRRLLELEPSHPGGLGMLSRLVRDHSFAPEVLVPLQAAIRNDPTNMVYRSQELLLLNFEEDVSAADLFERHLEFGALSEQADPARFDRFLGSPEPGRRLRIGYLSGDFCLHPAMIFLLPVLERHDRDAFEIFCYSTSVRVDHITQRVRERTEHWFDAKEMSDTQLADAIHADAIDILVDLTGHTTVPRLAVFSQRPAPVQVSWLGYLNTTGLTRMDYRLTDRRCDPPESSQALHTERLVMLPESQWCYRPLLESTLAAAAPVQRNGYVTFGSFNDSAKLSLAMCRRWAQILLRVPRSRLLICSMRSERKRDAIRREMTSSGVAPDQYEFVSRVDLDKFPDLLSTVDVALDSFPYGGGTTTFDCLWMGVPVVTAVGSTPVSRSAASILAALGLDDWVAASIDDYVDVAVARAKDHPAIVSLRQSLRPRLKASPLTDEVRFVHDLEAAYREMWVGHLQ
jgi:protein O-GlcNAc transferase